MDFHERLKFFIESKNLTVSAFESKLKFSNGSLSKALIYKRAIGSDRIETIFSEYSDLSSEWLFKGQGEMSLDSGSGYANRIQEKMDRTTANDLRKTISALEKVISLNELVTEEYRNQLAAHKRKEKKLEKR